jgi:hypothetical protein
MPRRHARVKDGSMITRALLVPAGGLALLAASCNAPTTVEQAGPHASTERSSMMQVPQSLAGEHHEIHETLTRATREPGELGKTAVALEQVLGPHFKREEEIAAPPLGLLPALAKGPATAEMRAVLPMTQALERELPKMLEEHGAVRDALVRFRAEAVKAQKPDYVRFCDTLAAHALQEEEILYPAAIVIGRYVDRTAPQS